MKNIFIFLFFLIFIPVYNVFSAQEYDLGSAINTALINNLVLKQKLEAITEAQGKIIESKSKLKPQVKLSANYIKFNKAKTTTFGFSTITISPDKQMSSTLTLAQPVYTAGKLRLAKKISDSGLQLSELELQRMRNEIIFNVVDQYYKVLQAKHLLEVVELAEKSANEHLKLSNDLKEQGVISKYEVLRTKVALSDIVQNKIQAENNYLIQIVLLKKILGIDLEEDITLKDVEVENFDVKKLLPKIKAKEAALIAIDNRAEISQLKLQKQILENSLKIEKKANSPDLFFASNYDFSGSGGLGATKESYNFALNLSWNLYDSGTKKGRVIQANAKIKSAEEQIQDLIRNIANEVGYIFLSLKETSARVENAKLGLEEANLSLKLAEERYANGISTVSEVLDTQAAFQKAQSNYYSAVYDFLRTTIALKKVMGNIDLDFIP